MNDHIERLLDTTFQFVISWIENPDILRLPWRSKTICHFYLKRMVERTYFHHKMVSEEFTPEQ